MNLVALVVLGWGDIMTSSIFYVCGSLCKWHRTTLATWTREDEMEKKLVTLPTKLCSVEGDILSFTFFLVDSFTFCSYQGLRS